MARRLAAAMLVAGVLQAAPPRADAGDSPLSEAQKTLFETPHLVNVKRPETLEYRFRQLGPGGFADRVTLTVAEIHEDGSRDLQVDFLTGERRVVSPGITHFRGNPLVMLFLEHDVRQMREQTGMAAAYFRDRIRQSFADAATVTDGTMTVDGKPAATRTIVVRPYVNDPHFGGVKVIAGKTYSFVVSAAVPGGIAAMRADAPADPAVGAPALGSTIDFEEAH